MTGFSKKERVLGTSRRRAALEADRRPDFRRRYRTAGSPTLQLPEITEARSGSLVAVSRQVWE